MKLKKYVFRESLIARLAILALFVTGGGNSAWAQKRLPYSYGFEDITSSNSGLSTEGWTLTDCYNPSHSTSYNGTSPYALSSAGYAGSNAFRFYPNDSYAEQCLISPELEYSATGIEVTFHYKSSVSSTPKQTFHVGYSSTDVTTSSFTWGNEISYQATTWETYKTTFPASTKYVAIKYTNTTTGAYLYLDGFEISVNNPYKTPTNFTLNSFTENSATFGWTTGNNESAWQFAYSSDSNFTPGTDGTVLNISENPYTVSGLTTGTTYYAAIRADYGDEKYSDWTNIVEFTPRAESETTINDATGISSCIPLYGSGGNSASNASQFILPSSQLSAISGRQITKIVFHTTSSYVNKDWGDAKWEVYMNEVSTTSFTSQSFMAFGTKVVNASALSVSNQELSIILDTPFNYSGGNLLIGFKTQTAGSATWCTFNGISATSGTNNGLYGISSLSYQSFYPKMTITSTPITTDPVQMGSNGYTTFASPRSLDLVNLPSGLKAYKAAVDGKKVLFTEINQAVPANTGMLLEGVAGETYNIPVAESGTAPEGNAFEVNSVGGTFTANEGYTYFGLLKDSNPLTFGTFAPGSVAIPTNKAYLKVLTSSLPESRQLTCLFYNETEGIQSMECKALTYEVYYNLAGQKVDKPSKGLYISNGKKIIIK